MKKGFPTSVWVVTHEFTCQNFDQAPGMGLGRCPWSVKKRNQKRDQANVKLRKLFPKILSQAEREKFQSRFLLEQLRCFPCWLCLRQNETQRICLGLPSHPFPTEFFLPLTPIVCTNGLSYADVITKFSGMYRFYFLLCMGLRCNLDKVLFK